MYITDQQHIALLDQAFDLFEFARDVWYDHAPVSRELWPEATEESCPQADEAHKRGDFLQWLAYFLTKGGES